MVSAGFRDVTDGVLDSFGDQPFHAFAVDDGSDDKVQARGAELLRLEGTIGDAALLEGAVTVYTSPSRS